MPRLKNLTQFFSYMNDVDFPYVVLRNWENLPRSAESGGHTDLDLLVYDFEHWKEIFSEAKALHNYPRVQFSVPIGDTHVLMDVRHVGDDYYPEHLEKAILWDRELNPKGFWTPSPFYHQLSLAYHVVHHKNVNNYQRHLGNATVPELLEALKASPVGWVEPKDPTVGSFNAYWKGATSVVENLGETVKKKQLDYKSYNLTENEYRILSKANSVHFPEVHSYCNGEVEIEHCGDPLTVHNLPVNWQAQMIEIMDDLKQNNIQHRDIKPDNLTVKNNIIKLIDFGWARYYNDPPDDPPSCLGVPYRPSWGCDDNFSMRKIIKELEVKVEGRECAKA